MVRLQKWTAALGWAMSCAWKIDKGKLIWWFSLSGVIALLPSIALIFNRQVVSALTNYLMYGVGSFVEVMPSIIGYGVMLTLIGLSARVNNNLLYTMMYDSYYLGMHELSMEMQPKVKMFDLLSKDLQDKYIFIFIQASSVTNISVGLCQILSKLIMITSLLIVAYSVSMIMFFLTLVYVLLVFILNLLVPDKDLYDWGVFRKYSRHAEYYENLPYTPGVAKELRVFQNDESLIRQWHSIYDNIAEYNNKHNKKVEKRNFVSGISFYGFLIVVIIYLLVEVRNRTMTADVFLVLYALSMNISQAISGLARDILDLNRGIQSAEKQMEFYGMPIFNEPDDDGRPFVKADEDTVFKAERLSFGYTKDKQALKDVSFEIKKGEVIALVGNNGSGKSTLTKLLLKIYEPSEGKLWFFGKDYDEVTIHNIRNNVGTSFQDYYIFHHTVRENVGYGDVRNVMDRERVSAAIMKGGATKIVENMPSGLETVLLKMEDKDGVTLSGGESQRIAVSRAHMSNREVMIFDEPAAMLDPIAEMEQFMSIKDTIEDRTAVLISHRVGFARLADRVFMMDNGSIIESGTHDELMAENGAYAHFFNEQAQWYKSGGGECED